MTYQPHQSEDATLKTAAVGMTASQYLAKVEADPRRAAALQRAREKADGVPKRASIGASGKEKE